MTADEKELAPLVELSARLGRQPLLVQASTGNTSIKIRDTLWIKASGKWMADADREDVFVPVNLADAQRHFSGSSPSSNPVSSSRLKPSIETAMHLTLPHRVVIHVHSVNTIAWAVQRDGCSHVRERLDGLRWCWIGYTPSGVPLAREIGAALHLSPNVFVLENHGLVVGGDSCKDAEARLQEVERRLAVSPRVTPEPDLVELKRLAALCEFQLPDAAEIHALGADVFSTAVVSEGILYPCQAMFLGRHSCVLSEQASILRLIKQYHNQNGFPPPALLIRGKGVLVANDLTPAESQMLLGLSEVVRRLRPKTIVSYLDRRAVDDVLRSGDYAEARHTAKPAVNYAAASG
jgi:rhamnose utilization protein RhaD (predicted bifunctional aldolase and dehydrogenase)